MGREQRRNVKGPARVTLAATDYWRLKGLRGNVLAAEAEARAAAQEHGQRVLRATTTFHEEFARVGQKYRFDPNHRWEPQDDTLELIKR